MAKSGDMTEVSPLLASHKSCEHGFSPQKNTVEATIEASILFDQKSVHWKNLLTLSFSFTFVLTSFVALQNMESTLNQEAGLGVTSLACIYGSGVIAGFFAPVFVRRLGTKKSVLGGLSSILVFVAVHAYPQFYTLIPASCLLGLFASIMWTAQAYFLTALATSYASLQKSSISNSIARFNGIFFFFYQNPQIWGNMISSAVLSSSNELILQDNVTRICGIDFCNADVPEESPVEHEISSALLFVLLAVLVVCDVLGIGMTLCLLDDIAVSSPSSRDSLGSSVWATLHHHKNRKMILLLPFFLYNGIGQAFIASEYTQAFPGCSLGLGSIGFVMVSYGVADASSSLVVGRLEKYFSRVLLFTMAAMLNLSVLVIMLLWQPTTTRHVMFYALPALWGIADGIWQPMTCSFLGLMFLNELEVTFALFRIWQSLGCVLIFGISYFVCMSTKVATMTGCLLLGMVLYYIVEVDLKRDKNRVHKKDKL